MWVLTSFLSASLAIIQDWLAFVLVAYVWLCYRSTHKHWYCWEWIPSLRRFLDTVNSPILSINSYFYMVEKLLRCHTSILIDNIQSIIYDLYFFKQVNEYEKMVEVGYFYNFFSSLKTPFFWIFKFLGCYRMILKGVLGIFEIL